ncbi:UNVERIFIED_CONTAM: hypothetical protein Sradi_2518500 [Sesamum radiatum]|uniref:DUF8040 domain-containing protein n=1 Tax=Sesamum radiatum TaxID=300843 RepID=A0AAW2SKG8_SESRA
MTIPHQGLFFDNIRMTKSCFYALVDALTSRGLLPHGQTSRVSSIEEFALFMQTVGMHKWQRDNMERFQYLLTTINRRFHRVLSAFCAMAPELITRPSFTETHTRITNNPDFYPFFKWGMPSYILNHQVDKVIAYCTLHNFIHKFSNDDLIFNEPDEDTPADMKHFTIGDIQPLTNQNPNAFFEIA